MSASQSSEATGVSGEGVSSQGCTAKLRSESGKIRGRQSTTVQMQLKVIRKSLERLGGERKELFEVRGLLQQAITDMDKEIETLSKLKDLANIAAEFQFGNIDGPEEDDEEFDVGEFGTAAIESRPNSGPSAPAQPEPMITIKREVISDEENAE